MRIHYLQHVPFETPALIGAWASARGHAQSVTRLFAGEPLPSLDAFDWLIALGGPMGVYETDKFPWLADEIERIAAAVAAGRRVLGVCLGAQLLAAAIGGRVYPHAHKEIGWFDVSATPDAVGSWAFSALPGRFCAFHWHGDTFDLPRGAVRLAGSAATANQAFAFAGRAVGLQFHLEYDRPAVERMIAHCGAEVVPGRFVQSADSFLADGADARIAAARGLLHALLDALAVSLGMPRGRA